MQKIITKITPYRYIIATLLIATLAAQPLFGPGLLNTRGGGDSPFLLQRLHQLVTMLQDGSFPVRWMPDANYGHGYPFFHYYAPLSLYITAVFRLLGTATTTAIQLSQLLAFITAALATYALLRQWHHNQWSALLAATAYTLAPFHLVNVYVRGDSLAEFWAMAWYPLILLTADRWLQKPTSRRLAVNALAYAALILSHQISAMLFSPFFLLYLLAGHYYHQPSQRRNLRLWLRPALPILLAFALSAWFFVPALAEKDNAQLDVVTNGYFHYSNHFRALDLTQTSLAFDFDVTDGGAFRMGLSQTILALAGLFFLLKQLVNTPKASETASPNPLFMLAALSLTAVATFMITPLSAPLWQHLPLLDFTQFPWRFLSVQALGTSLLIAHLGTRLGTLPRPHLTIPALILILFYTHLGALQTDHLTLTEADITPERLAQYEWFTSNIGTTVSAEYLPQQLPARFFSSDWLITGNRPTTIPLGDVYFLSEISHRPSEHIWHTTAGDAGGQLLFPFTAWDGWNATLNGRSVPLTIHPDLAQLTLDIPPGQHTVVLKVGRPPIAARAEIGSLIALLFTLLLLRPWAWLKPGYHLFAYLLPPFLLITFFLHQRPIPAYSDTTLSWDFAQMGYLHHTPAGIPFADGALLKQITYTDTPLHPGETFTLDLTWENAPTTPFTLDLVSPAINRTPEAPVFATVTSTTAPQQTLHLTIPEHMPAGLWLLRLRRPDASALTPNSDQPRGDLFLRPLQITYHPIPIAYRDAQLLQAQPLGIENQQPGYTVVKIQWAIRQPHLANYQVALRLTNQHGVVEQCPQTSTGTCQLDTAPNYGFTPTTSWPAYHRIFDWLSLPIPPIPSGIGPYPIMLQLYDPANNNILYTRQLGQLDLTTAVPTLIPYTPNTTPPPNLLGPQHNLQDTLNYPYQPHLQFLGYTDFIQTPTAIALNLNWRALTPFPTDYTHFVHLVDSQTGAIVAQHDAMPRENTYPTSQWYLHEVVSDGVYLDITAVPPGTYHLRTGLYHSRDHHRLTIIPPITPPDQIPLTTITITPHSPPQTQTPLLPPHSPRPHT